MVHMQNVKFTVSTTGIALVVIETNEVLAEHIMPNISFATGGDAEDYEFVGYVRPPLPLLCLIWLCVAAYVSTLG